jgi:hypothetical protein
MSETRGEYGTEMADEAVEKRISLDVPKDLAKTLTLGDSITATVSGQVCGISTGYDKGDAKTICLDIKFSKPPKITTNQADASVRSMMGMSPKTGRTKNEADKPLNDLHDRVKRAY